MYPRNPPLSINNVGTFTQIDAGDINSDDMTLKSLTVTEQASVNSSTAPLNVTGTQPANINPDAVINIGGSTSTAAINIAGGGNKTVNLGNAGGTTTLNLQGTLDGASTYKVTGMPNPTLASDVANKTYADNLATSTHWKSPCRVTTAANLTCTYNPGTLTLTEVGAGTVLTVDGVTVILGDRVLVKDLTGPLTATSYGIYEVTVLGVAGVTPYQLTRADDYDNVPLTGEIHGGDITLIQQGTTYAGCTFVMTNYNFTTLDGGVPVTANITWGMLSCSTVQTTKGDLVGFNGVTEQRLAVGTDTHVLTANSAAPLGVNWAVAPPLQVSSVFTRTGAVTAQSGDYTASQVTAAGPTGAIQYSTGTTMTGDAQFVYDTTAADRNVSVGTYTTPVALIAGDGASHTTQMLTLQNTNLEVGVWTDVTTILASATGSTVAVFNGVVANQCFYVGGSTTFPAIFTNSTVVIALGGGSIVCEYWSGAAWTAVCILYSESNNTHAQYGENVFSQVGLYNIRFDTPNMTGWATKSLNGSSRYWVRWRIAVGITTSPTLEQVKLHGDSTRVNRDGSIEWFGASTPKEFFPITLESGLPGNRTIAISTNISIAYLDNQYSNGAIDSRGMIVSIPSGIDTSRGLMFAVSWISQNNDPTVSGPFRWKVYYTTVNPTGDVLDGTKSDNLLTSTETVPAVTFEMKTSVFRIPTASTLPGDFVVILLERDGTATGDPPDSYAGWIATTRLGVFGYRWIAI
jgi:hypothetical protein